MNFARRYSDFEGARQLVGGPPKKPPRFCQKVFQYFVCRCFLFISKTNFPPHQKNEKAQRKAEEAGVRRASSFGLQGMKTAGGRDRCPLRRVLAHVGTGKGPPSGSWPMGAGSPGELKAGARGTATIEQAACQPSIRWPGPVNCGARACGMSGFLPKAVSAGRGFRCRYRSVSLSPACSAIPWIPPGCGHDDQGTPAG